ncbi:hypothetical protein AB0M46_33920 [Dactylosporangium sp. NPDC051485]|uniref:hypothetical protein n=1 Tax=Dactylosporangium sp. NPDC051485 TaxID=3154846 RepID=UPI0034479721
MNAIEEPEPREDVPEPDDVVRSLPANMFKAYGISDSQFVGPAAIGTGSTSIGTLLNLAAGSRAPRFVNQPLDGAEVLKLVHTYAPIDTPGRLVERLSQRPVAYLSGPAGSGRTTAALVGLARAHSPDRITQLHLFGQEPIHAYFSESDLLRPGYGHIVEVPHRGEPASSELTQLSMLARRARASVVFIGTAGANNRQLGDYHVEHVRPESPEVFLVWLERRLRDRGGCVGACQACEGDCVRLYVERCRAECVQYLSVSTMTDAVRFAGDFAEHMPVGAVARDVLADRATLRTRAAKLLEAAAVMEGSGREDYRARRRLAQRRRAARLAFAVFHDYPLTMVFRATTALIDRLDEAAGRTRTGHTVLEHSLKDLLDDIRLDLPAGHVGTAGAARIAQLREPGLIRGLLDVAWHEYDTAREPLLRWLDDLTEIGDVLPVAVAAGLLCEYDFEQVRDGLLEGWAASKHRARRQAAAIACELAVHHPDLTPRVLATLSGWVELSGYRRDTAVRAYASNTFLRVYPLDGLTVLERAARDDLQRTSNAIPAGVLGIYDTHGAAVVRKLVDWADSPIANLRTMASRCLVRLADVRSDSSGGAANSAWPALLRQTTTGEVAPADHARLWPGALLQPATARQAWSALEGWIALAADDPALAEVLRTVLRHVFRDGPINRRAAFYLRSFWKRAMPDNPFLVTVADLLEARYAR